MSAEIARISQLPVDPSAMIVQPFRYDIGRSIGLGSNVFINFDCTFIDQGGIYIGDRTMIGPGVMLCTVNHPLDPSRRQYLEPSPIRIGKDCWIGARATVLPGVTIGDRSVVAAGSVVNRDVPPDTVVAGVPAKVKKGIPNAGWSPGLEFTMFTPSKE